MSLWGHHVLAKDVPVEDVLDGDVLGKDIKSTQGHKLLARMSLCGHHVSNKDVPVEDVPGKDIMSARGRPCVLAWTSSLRTFVSVSTSAPS